MHIIKLQAENVLRLKAVEIEPDGTFQIVTGANAQGKSSVLNAMYLAIAGGQASRAIGKPIREGEESAFVTLDLGDKTGVKMIVTREWSDKGTKLTVKAADGAKYQQPQTILDGLVGALSFDPLEFTRKSAKEQVEDLLDLVGLDFTDADAERAKLYAQRTETGQRAHAFGDLPKLPKEAPTRETPATEILDRIRAAQDTQGKIDQARRIAADAVATIEGCERSIESYRQKIAELNDAISDARSTIARHQDIVDETPTPEDIDSLRTALAEVEDHNKTARDNARIVEDRIAQKELEDQYAGLGHRIKAIDESKAKAIAEAEMPVDGLGFNDQGVTYNGIPFSQASSAEQIRVSLAMAMALNPALRVIRIMDGSLLDAASMAEVAKAAKAADAQVWIERVDDASESAVVIVDGEVEKP